MIFFKKNSKRVAEQDETGAAVISIMFHQIASKLTILMGRHSSAKRKKTVFHEHNTSIGLSKDLSMALAHSHEGTSDVVPVFWTNEAYAPRSRTSR